MAVCTGSAAPLCRASAAARHGQFNGRMTFQRESDTPRTFEAVQVCLVGVLTAVEHYRPGDPVESFHALVLKEAGRELGYLN
jgi:hypothetical protein